MSERCPWAGIDDTEYARYHDEEWGVPKTDDVALFEKLVLEGFQSGLSWITILRKRENFRKAFHGFDAKRIARYGDKDIARLMADAGIVRNRLKIEATIDNARAYLKLAEKGGLSAFLWGLLDGKPRINQLQGDRRRGGDVGGFHAPVEGAEGGGVPVRRPDDDVCLHAGDGHGQRSSRDVPSL